MTIKDFGEVNDERVRLYCIKNSRGGEVKITNYGSIVTSWLTRDNRGNYTDVLYGLDSLQKCIEQNLNAPGVFNLSHTKWNVEIAEDYSLLLHYEWSSYYNHQPVNINIIKHYKYTDDDELIIECNAFSNAVVPFDLAGILHFKLRNNISEYEVGINACKCCYEDNSRFKETINTSFNLKTSALISERLTKTSFNDGINYILDKKGGSVAPAATITCYNAGRRLEIHTDQPMLHISTKDNFVCLNPSYNSSLHPAETFHSVIRYKIVHL